MTESILESIKKLMGLDRSYTAFDLDIVTHINSIFMVLCQLGVGPSTPFSITGYTETWSSFVSDITYYQAVKSYIYSRVRMIFDPPTNSFLVDALNKTISEFEWRLMIEADQRRSDG